MTPRIVVTNDDGIDSPGIQAVARALARVAEVHVVAPAKNQSAVSRSITLRRELTVTEQPARVVASAFSVDGTPTDCVRLVTLGLVEDVDLLVSGINLGLNLGDDIAYSGTISAALEAGLNGIPAIAVSQQTLDRELGFPQSDNYDFSLAELVVPRMAQLLLPGGDERLRTAVASKEENGSSNDGSGGLRQAATVLTMNFPGLSPREVKGVDVTIPSRRYYQDELRITADEGPVRRYRIYGHDPNHCDRQGTDAMAIEKGRISITPIRQEFIDTVVSDELAGMSHFLIDPEEH